MPTIALVGADGAGKTTVARLLAEAADPPVTYLYMGVNLEASNAMLPTTRLALGMKRRARKPGSGLKPTATSRTTRLRPVRALLRTISWVAEEWYRQFLAWRAVRRGEIVLFDRHFLPDYYAHDVRPDPKRRTVASRLHGFMLRHVYPAPDLVIVLDAPPEVLRARKQEDTIEFLTARRGEYLALEGVVPRFEVVDAARLLDAVVADVRQLIRRVAAKGPGARP